MDHKTVIAMTTLISRKGIETVYHPVGSPVSIEAEEAARLVARGEARWPEAEANGHSDSADAVESERALTSDPELAAAILEVRGSGDPHSFTDSGSPRVEVLSELLGRRVLAAERDRVMAELDDLEDQEEG